MSDFYVYLHRRATDRRVFYVGKGRNSRATSMRMRNPHWHRVVARDGLIIEFVETAMTEGRAFELEAALICFFGRRDLGTGDLVNMTDGGEGTSGSARNGATAEKIGAALRGRKRSPEAVEKSRAGNTGKKRSPEHIAALVAGQKPMSQETRDKIRAAALGRKRTPESIEKSRIGFMKTWQERYGSN